MAGWSLESMPVGFRFKPTDEELINHFLKGKIRGRKDNDMVIPEIDVCKFEPWDLPGKSVIKNGDKEWFFFSPRNRKYTNGQRSNRATVAGYWKATGQDRKIKSRSSSGVNPIGMKKTLVFHRGRAPKGKKTRWLMHEYRLTSSPDNIVDKGRVDQGTYVLCRLFKQPEGKSSSQNCCEAEACGLSPTPTKSSPCETQREDDAGEVSEMPSNQKSSEIDMQGGLCSYPAVDTKPPNDAEKSLDDEVDSACPLSEIVESFLAADFGDYEDEMGTEIGPLLDALNSELNPDELLGVNSPLSKDEFPVSDSFPRSTHLNPPGFENSESDEVIKFIDGVLNLDDVPPGEFHDVNNVLVNPGLESAHPNMLHEYSNWGVTGEEDYGWTYAPGPELQVLQNQAQEVDVDGGMSDFLYNISFSSHNLRKTPHKNPVIGHSWDNIYGTRLEGELASDVTHVLQASYCAPSREESTIHDQFMSHTRENGGTGIKIRPRQTEIPAPSPSGQQGTAARRIRLRLPQSSSPVRDDEASSSLEDCESCSPPSPEHEAKKPSKQPCQQASGSDDESRRPGTTLRAASPQSEPELRLRRSVSAADERCGGPLRLKEAPKRSHLGFYSMGSAILSLMPVLALVYVGWRCFGH